MRRIIRSARLWICILAMGVGHAVCAQDYSDFYNFLSGFLNADPNAGLTTLRSLSVPMGGLNEAMGTAYTAVARDASYFEANPAASSSLDSTELAVFHNNWIGDTKIESAVYTTRIGSLGLGAAAKWLYLPFTAIDLSGRPNSAGYYSETMIGANVSYNFFESYSFGGLAVGITPKIAFRLMPEMEGNLGAANSAFAYMADIGVLTRFDFLKFYYSRYKNFALGLAAKNIGPLVQGDPLPSSISMGFAWNPFKFLTWSVDVTKPLNFAAIGLSESFYFGTGVSVNVSDNFQMQGGFLVKGANPRISIGSTFDFSVAKLVANYTLDLTTQFTPLNRISLEASFPLGDSGRAAKRVVVTQLYLDGLEAYTKGNIDAAIALWKEALRLDPGFDPAQKMILQADTKNTLPEKLEELRKNAESTLIH